MSETKTPDMPYAEVREAFPAPSEEVVTAKRVSCDGGAGGLGHPRVWLTIDPKNGWVDCGYCDKRFVHESVAGR